MLFPQLGWVFNLAVNWIQIFWIPFILITLYDVWASKRQHKQLRVPFRIHENIIFAMGILGGALPIYIIMRIAKYKTNPRKNSKNKKSKKFTVGFPIMIAVHAVIYIALYILTKLKI